MCRDWCTDASGEVRLCSQLRAYVHSNSARMSSLVVPTEELLPLLLAPLDGGVFRSGGSKYDRSSIGSTLSGNSWKDYTSFIIGGLIVVPSLQFTYTSPGTELHILNE